ncbi:MAG TPA: diguanylate cyclase [Thermoleophilaceae bacterium]|jgi:diguanylate cyclase (GGDEF)-like protein/putative nucleotidyltransferase with HDIG domain
MTPPLRERLRWRNPTRNGIERPATRAAMASTGVLFAAAGAFLSALSALISDSPTIDKGLLVAVAGASAAGGIVLLLVYDRMPLLGFHVAAALATVIASLAIYAQGEESIFGPLPYVWVALFVFYFFPYRAALCHLGWIAVAYAVTLAAEDATHTTVDGWIATVVTLLVAGSFVALVRTRLASLIASLSDAANRDPVTELLNRRGFEEAFDLELERARRSDTPLSLVVGDLDRFKRVNDELGHAAGDEALRRIARAIRLVKRRFDSVARIGGEEFALLAPDCDEHGAFMLAERIRGDVEERFARSRPTLTISFGVATFPLHGQSAEALLRAADQALYAAKRLGRNRSVISSAEVPGILARAPRGHEESHVELASLLSLAEALDVRDSGSTSHCHRVGRFAELTARELGLPPDSVEHVRLAGILHDVGRVGVPDSLLHKDGPLTPDELTLVRSHAEIGARMLETTGFDDIRSWILLHHERPDGNGYPLGRHAVPLEARILGVADAYEAMTSDRPYRAALSPEAAATELRREAGTQFDSDVVEALLRAV